MLDDTPITFKRLQDEQSCAFLMSGELARNTVTVMAATRDLTGKFRYAIERCSGEPGQVSELVVVAKVAAANKFAKPLQLNGNYDCSVPRGHKSQNSKKPR